MTPRLEINGVSKAFGGVWALRGIDLTVAADTLVGVIGPNGSGKSTLFDVIAGSTVPDAGQVLLDGRTVAAGRPDLVARVGIRRTFQVPRVARQMTVLENLLLAIDGQPGGSLATLFNPFAARRVAAAGRAAAARALAMAQLLGIADVADRPAGTLSGGQLKLVSLAVALLGEPTALLLDEPMAGVNRVLVDRISELLRRVNREQGVTVVLIEHNLAAVEALCERVVALDEGQLISDGSPGEVKDDPAVRAAYLGKLRGEAA